MSATCLVSSINTLSSSSSSPIITPRPTSSIFNASSPYKKLLSLSCRASSSSSSSSSITDFDLYDLLGLESFSDQSKIKAAYRTLQKRCHPDIAGPAGHDMAIILNQAYSVLSDPISRQAYDKEQAKLVELKGYTGKPIYSVWQGSETEHRAVFVDELKCVGCLKCALCAGKTFAIESVYGRARVVAQWADSETKIQEAIEACPVDCISMVERSDLASLEFLMSKQPRGNVRVGAGNTVGVRVSNIFAEVKKFQARYADAVSKNPSKGSNETDSQREALISAIQAIRSISNWLHWQSPISKTPSSNSRLYLTYTARKSADPDIKKLQDAVAARNQGAVNKTPSNYLHGEEYWVPSTHVLPPAKDGSYKATTAKPETMPVNEGKNKLKEDRPYDLQEINTRNSITRQSPIGIAIVAAFLVQLHIRDGPYELKEHIGGSLALSVVNSPWLQVVLAGFTWYLVGVALVELLEVSRNKQ